MLPEWTVVGFTGHRSIADPAAIAAGISGVLDELAALPRPLLAISSLAAGSDLLFVREVARREIPFLLIFPFPRERFCRDFTPDEWRAMAPLIEQAAHVEELRGAESDEEAYLQAGAATVDQADVLLAVWDGRPAAGPGGTGDVVAYARGLRRPLVWLDAASGAVVRERLEHLNRTPGDVTAATRAPRRVVEDHYRELDATASRNAPSVRHLIQRVVLLHLLASVLGTTALVLHVEGVVAHGVAVLEVAVLAIAFVLTSRRHHAHAAWLHSRLEAEICRSFLATWAMRAYIDRPPRVAIPGFERLVRNLHLLRQMDAAAAPPFERACREYLEGRVRHQMAYFDRQCAAAQRASAWLTRLAMTGTALAALMGAGHVLLSLLRVEGPAVTATELLSLVLPLVSAALLSLVLVQEHSRRASRYREMVALLDDAARHVAAAPGWAGLARVASETEQLLLNELVEWHAFRRFSTDPH